MFTEIAALTDLVAQVRALADLTQQHAGGLLNGEIPSLRDVYLLQRKALKEREQADLTRGGVVPYQPTLAEIFRAADRPDLHPVCAYHAVVDYKFTLGEVAAFLGLREADVQRMLEGHDRFV